MWECLKRWNTPLVRILSTPSLHKSLPEIISATTFRHLTHNAVGRETCRTEHLISWLRIESGELQFSMFKWCFLHCKVMKIQQTVKMEREEKYFRDQKKYRQSLITGYSDPRTGYLGAYIIFIWKCFYQGWLFIFPHKSLEQTLSKNTPKAGTHTINPKGHTLWCRNFFCVTGMLDPLGHSLVKVYFGRGQRWYSIFVSE